MLGDVQIVAAPKQARSGGRALLRVNGLALPGSVSDLSFSLEEGEVLGIAGLVGAGRTEVRRCIAGAEAAAEGIMWLSGIDRALPKTVREAIRLGIVLAPEDRKRQGLEL